MIMDSQFRGVIMDNCKKSVTTTRYHLMVRPTGHYRSRRSGTKRRVWFSSAINEHKAMERLKGEGNIEAWVQSKITKAADYIDAAADYLDSGEHNVHDSMDEEKNPCWKRYKRKNLMII